MNKLHLSMLSAISALTLLNGLSAYGATTFPHKAEKYIDPRAIVKCGDQISRDTVLINDLLNCSSVGLSLTADNITLDCNGHLIDAAPGYVGEGIKMIGRNNVKVINCKVTQFDQGIWIESTSNSTFSSNEAYDNEIGIRLINISVNNSIRNNIVRDNSQIGIVIQQYSDNNKITQNNLVNNIAGIWLYWYSRYNALWDNNFINNIAYSAQENNGSNNNSWNTGTSGNYWDDFLTNQGYPNYYIIIGDGGGIDYYPKQNP